MAIMQRVREKMRRIPGMTISKAVAELHKDVPDYRIPSEVLFPGKPGRMFSEAISGKYTNLFLRFTRFHYSVAKSFAYPAADIVKGLKNIKDPAARSTAVDGVGKLVSLAVSYELLNAVCNPAVQYLTGDEKARIAMWGPLGYVRLIDDIVSGRVKKYYERGPGSFAADTTVGVNRLPPTAEERKEFRKTPEYKAAHPRKSSHHKYGSSGEHRSHHSQY